MEWYGIVGLAVTLVTLIFGALGLRGKAAKDYVEMLKSEVDTLRTKLKACEEELDKQGKEYEHQLAQLRGENQWLRNRLMERSGGD